MCLWRKINRAVCLILVMSFGFSGWAFASESSSSDYQVDNVFFGSGGSLNSCSATYCSKQSLGETGVGDTKSSDYQAQAGFNVNREPYLQLTVNNPNTDLGIMNSGTTYTTTSTFSVKSYLASGYIVSTVSPGPTTPGPHTLNLLTTPTASNASQEQFGINLAANNSCSGISNGAGGTISGSAGPVQVPSSAYSYGAAAHNSGTDYYDTACKFMYKNGDTIAGSTQSSGETDYTISYIFNIAPNTPAGLYTLNQTLVATSTY